MGLKYNRREFMVFVELYSISANKFINLSVNKIHKDTGIPKDECIEILDEIERNENFHTERLDNILKLIPHKAIKKRIHSDVVNRDNNRRFPHWVHMIANNYKESAGVNVSYAERQVILNFTVDLKLTKEEVEEVIMYSLNDDFCRNKMRIKRIMDLTKQSRRTKLSYFETILKQIKEDKNYELLFHEGRL